MTTQETSLTPPRLLRRPAVLERVALSDTTICRLERAGKFPRSMSLSLQATAPGESDIEAWIAERAEASR
jgi:prophage regulatory protein